MNYSRKVFFVFILGTLISCSEEETVNEIQKSYEWADSESAMEYVESISDSQFDFSVSDYTKYLSRFEQVEILSSYLEQSTAFSAFKIPNFNLGDMISSITYLYPVNHEADLSPPRIVLPVSGIYSWNNDLEDFIFEEPADNLQIHFPIENGGPNTHKASIELEVQDDTYYKSTLIELNITTIEYSSLLIRLDFSYSWYPYDGDEVQFLFFGGTFIDEEFHSQFTQEGYYGKVKEFSFAMANWQKTGLFFDIINSTYKRYVSYPGYDWGTESVVNNQNEKLNWEYIYNGKQGPLKPSQLDLYLLVPKITHGVDLGGIVKTDNEGNYTITFKDKSKSLFPSGEGIINTLKERIE